jgi:hypothetical protein
MSIVVRILPNSTFTAELPLIGLTASAEPMEFATRGEAKCRILQETPYVRDNTDGYVVLSLADVEAVTPPGTPFYAGQERNTTVAYVNGIPVWQFDDNNMSDERAIRADLSATANAYLSERVVFGNGRVALVFKTRSV